MRSILIVIVFTCFSIFVSGQTYTAVDNASSVKFMIKNFGVNVGGTFKGLQGKIHFSEADLTSCVFDVSVDANTVNTGINGRDNHLRKEEYFNIEKFPKISFVSKHLSATGKSGNYIITGNINIKGTVKEISFPFTATPQNDGFLFEGTFKLNRRDFKVGGSSLILSDNLIVSLSVIAKK